MDKRNSLILRNPFIRLVGKRFNYFLNSFGLEITQNSFSIKKNILDSYKPNLIVDIGANIGQFGLEILNAGFSGRLIFKIF